MSLKRCDYDLPFMLRYEQVAWFEGNEVRANYALGFSEYFKSLLPDRNVQLVAGMMMTAIFIIKLFGVKTAMQLQKLLVVILFSLGGAMFAVASSLNAVFAWAPKGLEVAVHDGWLPA